MATPEQKRRSMDAISHRETRAQVRAFRGSDAPKAQILQMNPVRAESRSVIPQNVKRMAMNAISSVETVAQVGVVRATGGIALYVARIREADREAQRDRAPKRPEKTYYGGSQGFLRD